MKSSNLKTNNCNNPAYSLFMLAVITLLLSSCQFSKKTASRLYSKASAKQYDMIVVPGIQFEDSAWSRIMKGRIYWAKHLYDRGIAKNIMFSGSSVYTPYYESEIMAMYAVAIGVPKEHVFAETKAEHSTENIYYSYKKSTKLGFQKIALASDPFQTKMLRSFTRRRVSRDVDLIPFVIDTMKVIELEMKDPKIDFAKAFNPNFVSIKKREGGFKRLTGTFGWRVRKDYYEDEKDLGK